ncbi:hypothetical protein [Shivajiella indica]|uniref:DUF1574 domain-containing protein n=1 Tax=Shivajiella indica TaxID=872115 RepID=A0ABW5BAX5_9BACT
MNRFILKTTWFSFLTIFSLLVIFLLENGTADPFYQRLITGKKRNLILGTSTSAQGLVPSVLNEKLGLIGEDEIFNFSFTVIHSPYGKVYKKRILEKLDSNCLNCIFILTIDPWSLVSEKIDPENEDLFVENGLFLNSIESVNGVIFNLDYLFFHYINSYYEILLRYFTNNSMILHKDGWLEIQGIKEKNYEKVLKSKLAQYSNYLNTKSFSETRFLSLKSLIDELSMKGDVYLVRLPSDPAILEIDEKMIPDFERKMEQLSLQFNVPFLNLSSMASDFEYTDGNHLTSGSAKDVTKLISDWIIKNQ